MTTVDDRETRTDPGAGALDGGADRATLDRLAGRAVLADDAGGARDTIRVVAPFTGEPLGRIPRGTPADIEAAVRRARAAQPAWARRSVRARSRVLVRFHDLLLERQEEALDLIQLESGKARRHALEEVQETAGVARHYAYHARRYLRPRRHSAALPLITTVREVRHPVGVVGAITPWNFPLVLSVTDLIAALAAGNAAVLRPDPQASLTALWATELLREAGLPRDVMSVVTGAGPEVGPALIDRVDYVMFTGSTRTGRIVAERAAPRLIGHSLELGGKNSMLVLDDAEVDAAVEGAVRGAFVGAGQVCVSIERIYVHASLFDRFAERFVERVRAMELSAGLDYGAEMGSLTVPRQLENVEAHVRDALEKGATLLAGGRPRPDLGPLFYEPTVLTGVTPEMKAYAEETFGPVVALYPFDAVDDAVARVNDTRYGLSASVWSRNVRRAVDIAKRIRSGSVNVNEAYGATWSATRSPIGGMNESGLGRRHGAEGILKYTDAQTIAVQRWLPLAPPPFLSERTYARVMRWILGLIRRVPGLR